MFESQLLGERSYKTATLQKRLLSSAFPAIENCVECLQNYVILSIVFHFLISKFPIFKESFEEFSPAYPRLLYSPHFITSIFLEFLSKIEARSLKVIFSFLKTESEVISVQQAEVQVTVGDGYLQ